MDLLRSDDNYLLSLVEEKCNNWVWNSFVFLVSYSGLPSLKSCVALFALLYVWGVTQQWPSAQKVNLIEKNRAVKTPVYKKWVNSRNSFIYSVYTKYTLDGKGQARDTRVHDARYCSKLDKTSTSHWVAGGLK